MKLRQRKRAHMRNKRAQVGMLGRWMTYQHLRLWPAIERMLTSSTFGAISHIGQQITKDAQRIIVRKMIADIVGKNPTGVIVDEYFGATK